MRAHASGRIRLLQTFSRWVLTNPVIRRARLHARVMVGRQAGVRIEGEHDEHVVLLRDLSMGGACIRSDMRLGRGDSVRLRVDPEDGEPFELTATVVSVREDRGGFFTDYGLRLVELDITSAGRLESFLERHIVPAKNGRGNPQMNSFI